MRHNPNSLSPGCLGSDGLDYSRYLFDEEDCYVKKTFIPGSDCEGYANTNRFIFGGMLDDIRIYNTALSAEEILWMAGVKTAIDKPF